MLHYPDIQYVRETPMIIACRDARDAFRFQFFHPLSIKNSTELKTITCNSRSPFSVKYPILKLNRICQREAYHRRKCPMTNLHPNRPPGPVTFRCQRPSLPPSHSN